MALKYTSNIPTGPLKVSGGPVDIRTVVQSTNDLMGSDLAKYIGLVAYVLDESELYVCFATGRNLTFEKTWKKIGGDVNPEDLGARVFDSVDELTSEDFKFAHKGMIAYVDGELYILSSTPNTDINNWVKIFSENDATITTDGSAPKNGFGISIDGNASDAFVEELYVDAENGIKGDNYYTSRGLNSSLSNGGDSDSFDGIEYITLVKDGGESWIRFYNIGDNWIEMNIVDDSLGINLDGITYKDADGNIHPYVNGTALPKETLVSFGSDLDLTGLTENRSNGETLVFGENGSSYDNLDIYEINVLPNVYAYADGTPVRILTDGDKSELVGMISDASNPDAITIPEILDLFKEEI